MPRTIHAAVVLMGLGFTALSAQDLSVPGNPLVYEVQEYDNLWNLSGRFYGNPFQWTKIHAANPSIRDPHWIYPGQKLTIPGRAETQTKAIIETPSIVSKTAAPVLAPSGADTLPAEPLPVPAAMTPKPLPKISETFPAADKTASGEISEEFPPALAGQTLSLPKKTVPLDWKPLGRIAEGNFMNATDGDAVEVRWSESMTLQPGDVVYVVQHAGFQTDPKTDKKTGIYLQNVAQIRVTKASGPRNIEGIIEKARDGVQPGDSVQLGAP